MSLTLAVQSLFWPTMRGRADRAAAAADAPAPVSPVRLGDWLDLATAAGVAAVPARQIGDMAVSDLAALSVGSEDPVSPEGRAAVERLAEALRDAPAATVLRWDFGCLDVTLAAVKAGRRPSGPERGYSVFRGQIRPCFHDSRLMRETVLWPVARIAAWLRPWVEARKLAGKDHPYPEVWRVYCAADGVAAASLVHPEAPIAPDALAASGVEAALAAARRLFIRIREELGAQRPQPGAVRPDGLLFALDFLIDESGQALLLDGSPAPADDRARPAWRGCFPPGAAMAGIAIGRQRILPLPDQGPDPTPEA